MLSVRHYRMFTSILHLGHEFLYPALLGGIILAGGVVLVPAMYAAVSGMLSLFHLFLITLLAGFLAEAFWYSLGRITKREKIYRLSFVKKRMKEAQRFSAFFQRHGLLLVFLSKFIYGTRIASHMLAGTYRLNFLKYITVTTLGTAIWFAIFYILLKTVDLGVASVRATTMRIQIVFLISALLLVLLNWFTGTYFRRKIMKRQAFSSKKSKVDASP